MLAVSPLGGIKDERESEMVEKFCMENDELCDFAGENLLESIDFDDLFVSISEGDLLPDLEMDTDILAGFSVSGGEESAETNGCERVQEQPAEKEEEDKSSDSFIGSVPSGLSLNQGEETVSKGVESAAVDPSHKGGVGKGTKLSSAQFKNPQGKRKVKVDWTPELHRRFVQAVEQLGVDKAVPSKILEIMGIGCLTRHNIASHLQKYRSQRKHLLAREAEVVSWNQRRQVYAGGKRDMSNPWPIAPTTMGFPPMLPLHHFRPLHVWGHPSMDQSLMQFVWPKHLPPSMSPIPPPPATTWPPAAPPHPHPPAPPRDPPFWHLHHYPRFQAPPPVSVPAAAAIPTQPPMYEVDPVIGVPTPTPHPPFHLHPSMESVDAAIGDALSKPWQPLPLGLKPPSTDGVLVELQRQGISSIPPTCR